MDHHILNRDVESGLYLCEESLTYDDLAQNLLVNNQNDHIQDIPTLNNLIDNLIGSLNVDNLDVDNLIENILNVYNHSSNLTGNLIGNLNENNLNVDNLHEVD